jgi:hypothetical protein
LPASALPAHHPRPATPTRSDPRFSQIPDRPRVQHRFK